MFSQVIGYAHTFEWMLKLCLSLYHKYYQLFALG